MNDLIIIVFVFTSEQPDLAHLCQIGTFPDRWHIWWHIWNLWYIVQSNKPCLSRSVSVLDTAVCSFFVPLRYIHTEPLVATTSGRYLWLKNNVWPLQRHKWLDQWPSSTEDKMHFFVSFYFVVVTNVNRVYTHIYYNV